MMLLFMLIGIYLHLPAGFWICWAFILLARAYDAYKNH